MGHATEPRRCRRLAGIAAGARRYRSSILHPARQDSVDTLGDDSGAGRSIEFGPLERRTIGHDFRRTGAVEAISGGAKAEQLAHAMGNTLSASNALFATYVPVNV